MHRKVTVTFVPSVKDKEEKDVDSEARPMKDETFGEYRWVTVICDVVMEEGDIAVCCTPESALLLSLMLPCRSLER